MEMQEKLIQEQNEHTFTKNVTTEEVKKKTLPNRKEAWEDLIVPELNIHERNGEYRVEF